MIVSFPRIITNHDISKFSTVHTIPISCRRNIRCKSVFHGTLKTTKSQTFTLNIEALIIGKYCYVFETSISVITKLLSQEY